MFIVIWEQQNLAWWFKIEKVSIWNYAFSPARSQISISSQIDWEHLPFILSDDRKVVPILSKRPGRNSPGIKKESGSYKIGIKQRSIKSQAGIHKESDRDSEGIGQRWKESGRNSEGIRQRFTRNQAGVQQESDGDSERTRQGVHKEPCRDSEETMHYSERIRQRERFRKNQPEIEKEPNRD